MVHDGRKSGITPATITQFLYTQTSHSITSKPILPFYVGHPFEETVGDML
jgi:hypothetical protein